jgi:hypothetical protein
MFSRVAVQAAVDEQASLPHTASILSPYAFEIRPRGFPEGVPNYRVLVERVAFRMRAVVVPDYLAVSVVAAVVAGARNNPKRVEHLRNSLAVIGWQPEIELSTETFRLEALSSDTIGGDEMELGERAIAAGMALSEFVLDQLIVTQPIGEMRPAVERTIGEERPGDVWLYDPSERDRSTQVHRSLENWLMAQLRDAGVEPMDPAGEPYFDLAWVIDRHLSVCEVKSSANSEVHQLRLGLGQIIQYRHMLRSRHGDSITACILIEGKPLDARWLDICADQDVLLFWPALWDDVADRLLRRNPRP